MLKKYYSVDELYSRLREVDSSLSNADLFEISTSGDIPAYHRETAIKNPDVSDLLERISTLHWIWESLDSEKLFSSSSAMREEIRENSPWIFETEPNRAFTLHSTDLTGREDEYLDLYWDLLNEIYSRIRRASIVDLVPLRPSQVRLLRARKENVKFFVSDETGVYHPFIVNDLVNDVLSTANEIFFEVPAAFYINFYPSACFRSFVITACHSSRVSAPFEELCKFELDFNKLCFFVSDVEDYISARKQRAGTPASNVEHDNQINPKKEAMYLRTIGLLIEALIPDAHDPKTWKRHALAKKLLDHFEMVNAKRESSQERRLDRIQAPSINKMEEYIRSYWDR